MAKKRRQTQKAKTAAPSVPRPECDHAWELLPANFSSMSDGQQSDYMAGFNMPARCRRCGVVGLIEGPGMDDGV